MAERIGSPSKGLFRFWKARDHRAISPASGPAVQSDFSVPYRSARTQGKLGCTVVRSGREDIMLQVVDSRPLGEFTQRKEPIV